MTTDSNPRACALDPRRGTALVLAEGVANLACVGATPVAVVNCLNFGNPEHPEVMWQLSECIDGMAAACRAFELPVIGGNVSFYNESGGRGHRSHARARRPRSGRRGAGRRRPGSRGPRATPSSCSGARAEGPFPLEGTRWAAECRGHRAGAAPAVDVAAHAAACALVAELVAAQVAGRGPGPVGAVHDVSAGGLAVALAEMAAEAGIGCVVAPADPADPAELFTELPSRFVVATGDADALCARAASARRAGGRDRPGGRGPPHPGPSGRSSVDRGDGGLRGELGAGSGGAVTGRGCARMGER